MASFMTLQAYCEGCQATIDVYADELFEFDCKCRECGAILVLQEEGDDEEGEVVPAGSTDPADEADEADEAEIAFFDEATREDTREEGDEYRGADRPTTADSDDDPYAAAALALDPTGSDRFQRARVEEIVAREEPASPLDAPPSSAPSDGLNGTSPDTPPLPSWDGGDTQKVEALARNEPWQDGAPALDLGGQNALGDLVEVVEVTEGTSGRGSRTYDAEQMLAEGISGDPPQGEAEESDANTTQTLFGEDLDWLALIDDRLPEGDDDEDGAGRVFIRLPQDAASALEGDAAQIAQLQKTMESLESGGPASLGSLIWSGQAGAPSTEQRFDPDPEGPDTDTRRYLPDKSALPGPATMPHDKSALPGSATMPHGKLTGAATMPHARLPGEDLDPDDDARPTEGFPRKLETKKWAAAFAQERKPGDVDVDDDDDAGPTQSWTNGDSGDQPTANWRGKQPVPRLDMPTRAWEGAEAETVAGGAEAPSSRHLRRGDGVRVINKFRREDLDPALVCARDVGSVEADHFRQLYQQIFQSRNGNSPRVVLITSSRRGEGKTTVAANLAIAAARIPGKGVVLVDADPRGAGVLHAFGERSPMEGLLEALETGSEPSRYIVQFNLGHMDVVPLGIRGSNAAELIASDHMGDFLRGLRVQYPDWPIIVDSSACLNAADPLNLAQHVDGVVLVVRAGGTQEDEVNRVTELLGRKRVLGVVLNDAKGI